MFQGIKNSLIRFRIKKVLKNSEVSKKTTILLNMVIAKVVKYYSHLFGLLCIIENAAKNNPELLSSAVVELKKVIEYVVEESELPKIINRMKDEMVPKLDKHFKTITKDLEDTSDLKKPGRDLAEHLDYLKKIITG